MVNKNLSSANAQTITRELHWFGEVLNTRLSSYFKNGDTTDIYSLTPADLSESESPYAHIINHYAMGFSERLILILSLIPHVRPDALDIFFTKNENFNRGYTEFGGIHGNFHSGFLPTGETAAFILTGNQIDKRLELMNLFDPAHYFFKHNILSIERSQNNRNEPLLSNPINLSDEYLSLLTSGAPYRPEYSTNFPAKRITTNLEWSDLVLNDHVREELEDIVTWMSHGDTLMKEWGLQTRVKNGYRAMFYGPPGTGKTLTSCLIGKSLEVDTYCIDLSMIVSKYIGETEKNLARVFDQAENKNWILFFDEADALFGKRTSTNSSNDRHANQEVAYLLQRIEDFPGVVILASNLKGNLDDAFARRFQSMIYFPIPDREQRYELWTKAFQGKFNLEEKIDWNQIAEEFEITGGSITNVLRYCSIKAIQRDSQTILKRDIIAGIKKEHKKEGKA